MPIKNYTTSISEEKTVGEIMALLAQKKAMRVQIEYDAQGRPDAISFLFAVNGVPIPFKLPCNFDGVYSSLLKGFSSTTAGRQARTRFERNAENKAQARRIAWRIIKDWVAAQMALIEAEQASLAEVFLPYAVRNDGTTMFQYFQENIRADRALTAGPEVQS